MSKERFDWLNRWLSDPNDIYRTPGTESNVKEIYDACHDLAKNPENLILNQFGEYGNYIIHRAVTGPALKRMAGGRARENGKRFRCANGCSTRTPRIARSCCSAQVGFRISPKDGFLRFSP